MGAGHISIGATIADWLKKQMELTRDIHSDCSLYAELWDPSKGLPKDYFKAEAYTRWMELVSGGARWDFKIPILTKLGESIRLCDNMSGCNWYSYENPANIHFGYVGRVAGFTPLEMHVGAGRAQGNDNPNQDTKKWWYTLRDEPADYWAIEVGILVYNYEKSNPSNIDYLSFASALWGYRFYLKKGERPSIPYYNYSFDIDEKLGVKFPVDHFNDGKTQ